MHNNIRRMMAVSGAVVLALAAGAFAQQGEVDRMEGSLDRPLQGGQPGGQGGAQGGFVYMSENDGTTSYELEIRGGEVTAKINGRKLPADRVRREDGRIELLDREGKVLKTFEVQMGQPAAPAPRTPRARRGEGRTPLAPIAPVPPIEPAPAIAPEATPPKTMIGIRMSDDTGEVVVDDVIEGLPAQEAGLEPGDVLLSVHDAKIGAVSDVREALKDRAPGDKVKVVVRRGDGEKTLTLTLAAFDAERLGATSPAEPNENPWYVLGENMDVLGEDARAMKDEARRALTKALEEMKASPAFDADKLKKDVEQAMRQALKALEHSQNDMQSFWRRYQPGQSPRVLVAPDGAGERRTFVMPMPAQPGQDSGRLMEKLSSELERLHQRLDEIERRLPKNP
ncbi:MAG: PDZ domain-containing protein [Planctomycetota bacterium]|nr:PDZ domain-containing protein [Planctomycetota bacterium]